MGSASSRTDGTDATAVTATTHQVDETAVLGTDGAPVGSGAMHETEATSAGVSAAARAEETRREHPRGGIVGRYVILSRIGAGAMGTVYEAYDPQLDRRIALKLITAGNEGGRSRTRVIREAQALAQLTHPNVVAVHDVGTVDDEVFIAMELVAGSSLRKWLKAEERSLADVTGVLLDAGRGLAAVHRAGLIHRDIKPDNLIVGDDGRVRVADFGLARLIGDDNSESSSSGAHELVTSATGRLLDRELTAAGTIAGTPAYMAPERLLGETGDARADQFSFCVTAWEALLGARPFTGKNATELRANILASRRAPAPRVTRLPRRVVAALELGMQSAAEERWSDMEALIAALSPAQRRGRWLAAAAALSITAAIGLAVIAAGGRDDAGARCEASVERFDEAWNPDRAKAIARAWSTVSPAIGREAATHFATTLDRYVISWKAAHIAACEATHRDGTQSALLFDRRIQCLDDRMGEVRALVDSVTDDVSQDVISRAMRAAASLEEPSTCSDTARLTADRSAPLAASDRTALRLLEDQLARAETALELGRDEAALATVQAALERADAIHHAPAQADARLLLGRSLANLSRHDEAAAALHDAARHAAEAGDDHRLATLWVVLADVTQRREDRPTLTRSAIESADIALLRVGRPAASQALLHGVQGRADLADGQLGDAVAHQQRAVALLTSVHGDTHPEVADALLYLAAALRQLGRFEEGRAHLARATDIAARTLGPWHPQVGAIEYALGYSYSGQGKLEQALHHYQRSLDIYARAMGEDADSVALSANAMGSVLGRMSRPGEALQHLQRALAINELRKGPDEPRLAYPLHNIGSLLVSVGRPAEALPYHERGLRLREAAAGANAHVLVMSLLNLCETHLHLRRHAIARSHCDRALAILAGADGADLEIAQALQLRAAVEHGAGQPAAARRSLAEAGARLAPVGAAHPLAHAVRRLRATIDVEDGRARTALPDLEAIVQSQRDRLGAAHPELAATLRIRAGAHAALGAHAAARADLQEAWRILEQTESSPMDVAETALAAASLFEPAIARTWLETADRACDAASEVPGSPCARVRRLPR